MQKRDKRQNKGGHKLFGLCCNRCVVICHRHFCLFWDTRRTKTPASRANSAQSTLTNTSLWLPTIFQRGFVWWLFLLWCCRVLIEFALNSHLQTSQSLNEHHWPSCQTLGISLIEHGSSLRFKKAIFGQWCHLHLDFSLFKIATMLSFDPVKRMQKMFASMNSFALLFWLCLFHFCSLLGVHIRRSQACMQPTVAIVCLHNCAKMESVRLGSDWNWELVCTLWIRFGEFSTMTDAQFCRMCKKDADYFLFNRGKGHSCQQYQLLPNFFVSVHVYDNQESRARLFFEVLQFWRSWFTTHARRQTIDKIRLHITLQRPFLGRKEDFLAFQGGEFPAPWFYWWN